MRLFVSIDFPGYLCEELYSRVIDIHGWRKTPAGQIHLTLIFIGDCTQAEMAKISEFLTGIEFQPFEIIIKNVGVFPGREDPAILWCGVESTRELLNLQKKVETTLLPFRKKPDHKPFFPHITLARRKRNSGKSSLVEELLTSEERELRYVVDRFSLKKSLLNPGGSEHHLLKVFKSGNGGDISRC